MEPIRQSREQDEEVLAFWERERIFARTVDRDAPNGEFTFFEGPPTANAPPGIHHVESRTFKDIIPRYKTMRGYRVRRKAGWDTHGLPVELQIEKALGLKTKQEVEVYGVAKFNAACRDSVWAFKEQWEDLTRRIGYWVDMANPYITYEMSYVESIWWFLKQAWDRGLLARDDKIVPWCPRCETPLSSHEVAQGYEDNVEDPSVIVKFQIPNSKFQTNDKARMSMLVWTTTPWTLPGNGALAVHPDVEYAVVMHGDERLILAGSLVSRVLGEGAVIERTIPGKDLIGLRYEPLYARIDTATNPEAYQVLDAAFVSIADGTGIVHIAPAYGEEDFAFKARGIPPTFSVNEKGIMADGLPGAGKFAKQADVDVRADLTARGLLFRDETLRHTYPFCWRCKTPLLYFARASWYITMSKLRTEIQAKNQTIQWHPEHLRDGRFGEWLRELKDWAITRERYWGTPLPIWECDRCGHREVIGSFTELKVKLSKRNRFLLMRHGEAESNARNICSAQTATSSEYPLTEKGRALVAEAAEGLKTAGMTKIIASPFHRIRETAEIVSASVGVPILYDDRLREIDLPDFDGKLVSEHAANFQNVVERFTKKVGTNETWDELASRMMRALKDIDAQYEGETILICSHGDPLFLLQWAWSGMTREGITALSYPKFDDPHAFDFTGALVNDRGELDVHRPFVDAIIWPCAKGCGGTMQRFPEVVDVWMDSGCMPFAQHHYPFEQQPQLSTLNSPLSTPPNYPAEYISEAIDQTRGWFYTLLAVATVLEWDAPYEHVISLGHLLDAKGQKMSKSKGNVVNPWDMLERYGADVLRWYMVAINQPWDPKFFDEADLKRIAGKPFGTLANVVSFWALHGGGVAPAWTSAHVLDAWLRARVASVYAEVTRRLDAYEITEAARAIGELVDDVSTWWLRRSRERLKKGDADARATFTAALRALAILLAPFTPFTAERLWQTLRAQRAIADLESQISNSVHLASWDFGAAPSTDRDAALLGEMAAVRRYCSLGLDARTVAGMPVRQALGKLTVKRQTALPDALAGLIAEELNVKAVAHDLALAAEVDLDTTITPELKREGMIRELTRAVNSIRKELGLSPSDRIRVTYATDSAELLAAMREHAVALAKGTTADSWEAGAPTAPRELDIGGARIVVAITR